MTSSLGTGHPALAGTGARNFNNVKFGDYPVAAKY
jgi:hypothetical protein